jgi:hypothetical protein
MSVRHAPPSFQINPADRKGSYWQKALEPRISRLTSAMDPHDSYMSVPLARMTLESEERAIRTILSRVRSEVNKLSPTHKLSTAILQNIFLFLADAEPVPNESWSTRDRERMHWIKITYVSSQWRKAALACAPLWASPPVGLGSGRFYTFLGRSAGVPLALRFNETSELSVQLLLTAVDEQLHRIRALDASASLPQEVIQTLTQPAPILEVLRICPRGTEPVSDALDMPAQLFAGQAPRLHTIVLRGFSSFPLQPSILSNVVTLHVTRGAKTYAGPSAAELSATLASLQRVEDLALHGCLPGNNEVVQEPTDLRHLRRLAVSGAFVSCGKFFVNVKVPSTCRIHVLSTEFPKDSKTELPRMVDALQSSGYLLPGEFFRAMRLVCWESKNQHCAQIATWRGEPSPPSAADPVTAFTAAPCDLVLEFKLEAKDECGALAPMLRLLRLPLQRLRTLWVGGRAFYESDPLCWPIALGDCQDLEELYTEGIAGRDVVAALAPCPNPELTIEQQIMAARTTLLANTAAQTEPEGIRATASAETGLAKSDGATQHQETSPLRKKRRVNVGPWVPRKEHTRPVLFTLAACGLFRDMVKRACADARAPHVLFPRLRTLALVRDVDLEGDYGCGQMAVAWKVLQRVLLARREAGCPLGRVALCPAALEEGRYWTGRVAQETGVVFEATARPDALESRWCVLVMAFPEPSLRADLLDSQVRCHE